MFTFRQTELNLYTIGWFEEIEWHPVFDGDYLEVLAELLALNGQLSKYVCKRTEGNNLWTIGYMAGNEWIPVEDCHTKKETLDKVKEYNNE